MKNGIRKFSLFLAMTMAMQFSVGQAWAAGPVSAPLDRVTALANQQVYLTKKDREQFKIVLNNTVDTLNRVEKELTSGESAFPNSVLSAVTGVGLGVAFVAIGLFLGGDNKMVGPVISTAGIVGFALISGFSAVANILEMTKEKEINQKKLEEAREKSKEAQRHLEQSFEGDPEKSRRLREVSISLIELDEALLEFTQNQTSTSKQKLITVALQSLGVSIIVSSYILDDRLGPYTATVTWAGLLATQVGNINRLLLSANKKQKQLILTEIRATRTSIQKIMKEIK